MKFIHQLVLLSCVIGGISGHGRLINPPGRSTMWRYGFDTPVNSNDHQLSCGGFGVQYYMNDGKCGICGDRYDGPRDNEAGGKYATGTIAKQFRKGQTMLVQVEITVNHGGWFEFRLCPNNDAKKAATQECLDRYLLKQVNGEERFSVPEGLGVASVELQLPEGLTCSQCVLQWRWNTASNMRCDGAKCCRGCGPQEQFYGCADIAIVTESGYNAQQAEFTLPPYIGNLLTTRRISGTGTGTENGAAPNLFVPISGNSLPSGPVEIPEPAAKCVATKEYSSPAWDEWCLRTCNSGDDCPKDICTDECRQKYECRAKEFYRAAQGDPVLADKWCRERCSIGLCPLEYCENSCWTT